MVNEGEILLLLTFILQLILIEKHFDFKLLLKFNIPTVLLRYDVLKIDDSPGIKKKNIYI